MATVLTNISSLRYYCHQCQCGITPNLDDFTCPTCHGGFVEELRGNESSARDSTRPDRPNDLDSIFESFMARLSDGHYDNDPQYSSDDSYDLEGFDGRTERTAVVHPRRSNLVHTVPMSLFASIPFLGNRPLGNNIDMFEVLFSHLMNGAPSGPPPASDADIGRQNRIILTHEEASEHEKCSVCFEEYKASDNCIQLVCQHVFHEPCITTWLKRHGTCPVCRKDLNGRIPSDSEAPNGSTDGSTTVIYASAGGSGRSLFEF